LRVKGLTKFDLLSRGSKMAELQEEPMWVRGIARIL
jgi:hypothetical protein